MSGIPGGNIINFTRGAGPMGSPMPGGPGGPNAGGMPGAMPPGPPAAMPPPGLMPPRPPAPPGPGAPGPAPPGPAPGAMPTPLMTPPGMMINPAFQQWRQLSQAWHAEKQRREDQFLAACMTIRHDVADGYKIDIEADSTVAADEQAEKQARTEFLQSILPLLQTLIPEAQQNPGAVPLIHALVMFGVRAFPAARSLETTFEQAFRTMLQTPAQPPEPKGNTKSPQEIQAEAQIAKGEQQVDAQGNQIKAAQVQVAQQKNAIEMQQVALKAQQDQAQLQQEAQLRQMELAQQGQVAQSRQALDQARLSHLMVRDSSGLV
jgi:hypothetical protein